VSEIASDTVLAALVAASVALTGLIISKDLKTTEFRQNWIDSLRSEVAAFIAIVNLISYRMRIYWVANETLQGFEDELARNLSSETKEAERLFAVITMRLNPSEHAAVITRLSELKASLDVNRAFDAAEYHRIEEALVSDFQQLLKSEWERVKAGENSFKATKWIAVVVLVAVALFLGPGLTDAPNKALQSDAASAAPLSCALDSKEGSSEYILF
jgi:hypothetical protein